jgi:tetratricopeptide (TPR) repeat protein
MSQPSPAAAAAEKARMLLEVDRNDDAGKAAMEGLRSDPNNAHLMGLLAAALKADGYAADARHWAERSLAFDPQQAWVHNIRARAILDGAGHSREAVESAYAAVHLDQFDDAYRFTLTRAYLEAGRRADAEQVARSIRGVDPNSARGPLAEALVELDRARFLRINPIVGVVVVVATNGLALVLWAIWWLVLVARRVGPLRRADALVLEALRLDPGNPATHALAAEVAQSRFRYVQSVDASLASAAIDTGLVDADELARKIVRRTCLAALAAFVFWLVWTFIFSLHASEYVTGTAGIVVGLAAVAAVAWLDREQTRRLPAGMLRRVRRRWGLPASASVVAAYAIFIGIDALNSSAGLAASALLSGLAVAACAGVLIVRLYSARHTNHPR